MLSPNVQPRDGLLLRHSQNRSSKSAYAAFFVGTIKFGLWKRIWKSWAPPRWKFFIWLVFHNRYWKADCLAKRGLPHLEACPLCDQVEETIHHILVGYVFTRQIWARIFQFLGLSYLSPEPTSRFSKWWWKAISSVPKDEWKGLNSLIILVVWEVWKHRNSCVFENATPSIQKVLRSVSAEGILWCSAGPKKLQELLVRVPALGI